MKRNIFILLGLVLTILHCGGSYIGQESGGSLYLIVEEEIRNINATNAWDAINMLRPSLLEYDQRRTADMFSGAIARVYVDGVPYGEKDALRTINIEEVEQIEFLRPQEATLRYGSDHTGGIFMVTTR